ncbi:hypothetical protein P170DRAFT_475990 [Aspergillus steynii IBT 23096]|uniref:DUF7770 domain-containing protein n=1 Tax=Aspergillus steynii IBT 23096 TaxID=1392250 RepID=A0A2I2GA06_9EURO|nr:uncharacterized protein P170DRAFT_475990 [Aspergillus steynii IBT 23096]PLB49698.1 hypothetical protein P170DRAFT_475990 [Aspergillus steynii IBT 23096]
MPKPFPVQAVFREHRPVMYIRIAVLGGFDNGNHFSLFLVHAGNETSTRCTVRADRDTETSTVEWSNHNYTLSHSAIVWWDIPVQRACTVSDIGHMVYDNGRFQYEMPGGRGRRWWTYTILQDMVECGFIGRYEVKSLYMNFGYFYNQNGQRDREMPMVEGTFY